MRAAFEEQGFQQVEPAEGQQASVRLLQGAGQARHGDAHGHQLVVGVGDERHHAQVQDGQVHLDVLVYLPLRQRGIAVEGLVGLVHQLEDGLAVVLGNLLAGGVFLYLEVILALDEVRDAAVLVGDGVGDVNLELHPVGIFPEAQAFDMGGIVGIVVDGGHGAQLVEAFYQHALGIHVGEPQGALDVRHAPFFAPLLDGADEGFGHLRVINEVYPAEAHFLLLPRLVGPPVDDGGHAPRQLALLVGQEVLCLAELEGGVLLFVEGVQHVVVEVGHRVGVVLVQFVVEADESLQVPLGGNFLDCYGHIAFSLAFL